MSDRIPTSRRIEDIGFLVGVTIAALFAVGEFMVYISFVKKGASGFPYVTIILVLACVLPKTVGRATAGRVWEVLANRFGGRRSKAVQRPPFNFSARDDDP